MKRLPRIDKRNADPGLLRQYQDMRNKRRSSNVHLAVPIVGAICMVLALTAVVLQPGNTALIIVSLIGFCAIFGVMFLMAGFSPRGSRAAAFLTVITVIVLLVAGSWFLDWLVGKLI